MIGRVRRHAVVVVALALASTLLAACGGDHEVFQSKDWSPAPHEAGRLSMLATSDRDGFRLFTASGHQDFLPGVNLGSSTPLHQPGEIGDITAKDYRRWLHGIGEVGARVVRIYTLPPPAFYEELAAYNKEHAQAPLYLVQGVYLPDESYNEPGKTLYTPAIDEAFAQEIKDVVAAVHGDLTRPRRPGRAGGTYRTDVSTWLVAWIAGVEIDPAGSAQTDRIERDHPYTPGRYFRATSDATPTERWLAGHLDALAGLEAARGVTVPIAFANWPTDDPLVHPREPLKSEDLANIDANHVLPTAAWPGGTFASFHAYPYYPDFQRYAPDYAQATWRGKPDRYAGYLDALKAHFAPHMPLLVTEYGVPSSLGSAHIGTNGRDQGDHSEQESMAMNADMMRMMAARGIGGAFVFEWTDEWFKRTWNTMEHQDAQRRQLWHDPLTNEQWFGLVATDPEPVTDAAAEKVDSATAFPYLYAWADASWVHLDVTTKDDPARRLVVEADVVPGPEKADYRIVVDREAGTAKLYVRAALDPIRLDTSDRPYRPDQAEPWHLFKLIVNRDYRNYPKKYGGPLAAEYQDVGNLIRGSWDPDDDDYDSRATWQVDEGHDTIRLRIPWSMLGMADPSAKLALGEGTPARMVKIDGITFRIDADGDRAALPFTWPAWNYTSYRERPKAGLGLVQKAMHDLAP